MLCQNNNNNSGTSNSYECYSQTLFCLQLHPMRHNQAKLLFIEHNFPYDLSKANFFLDFISP